LRNQKGKEVKVCSFEMKDSKMKKKETERTAKEEENEKKKLLLYS